MTDQQPRHVFISYVRENQEQVDRLCKDLEQHGVKVWLDRKSIKPGARWKGAIREAIRHGDFFIACFSTEYTSKAKTYMNEELTLATEELRKFASNREWFIPVLLSECDVPDRSISAGETLRDINWVSLYEDWDAGIQRILSAIKPTPVNVQNLIYASGSKNRDVSEKDAQALEYIGPEAKAAVPDLIENLKDQKSNPNKRDLQLFEKFASLFSENDIIRFYKEHDFLASFDEKLLEPLNSFIENWDNAAHEFIDNDLEREKKKLYAAAYSLGSKIAENTVPIHNDYISVKPDHLPAGPTPDWVIRDAKEINDLVPSFVECHENFIRLGRRQLY